jgi:hypothetical protein
MRPQLIISLTVVGIGLGYVYHYNAIFTEEKLNTPIKIHTAKAVA